MRSKTLLVVLLITFSLVIVGCASSSDKINGRQIGGKLKDVLPSPNKIVIYKDGTQNELGSTDPRFAKIVELTNGRFHDKLSTCLDIIDDNAMATIRNDGLGIEFQYFTQHELSIKGDGFQPLKYKKLYFQLTSQRYGNQQGSTVHTFQHAENDQYTKYSSGPLKYSEELVSFVKAIR